MYVAEEKKPDHGKCSQTWTLGFQGGDLPKRSLLFRGGPNVLGC